MNSPPTVHLLCTFNGETYDLYIDPITFDPLRIIRSSTHALPEYFTYDSLGPIVRDRIDQRIRSYADACRRQRRVP